MNLYVKELYVKELYVKELYVKESVPNIWSESLVVLESQFLLGVWFWLRFLVTLEVGFGLSMSNSYSTLLRTSVPKETTSLYLLLTGRPAEVDSVEVGLGKK